MDSFLMKIGSWQVVRTDTKFIRMKYLKKRLIISGRHNKIQSYSWSISVEIGSDASNKNHKLRLFIACKSFDTVSKWILVTWFTGSRKFAMLGNLFGLGLYFRCPCSKSGFRRIRDVHFFSSIFPLPSSLRFPHFDL